MKHFIFSLFLLFSFSSYSQTMFERHYGGVDNDIANSIFETSDGNYVFTGETRSTTSYLQVVFTVKLDIYGDTIWTRTADLNNSSGLCIIETQDNHLLVSGRQLIGDEICPILIKYDSEGNIIWTKEYSEYASSGAYTVVERMNGDLVFTCKDDENGKIIGTDQTGNYQWKKTFSNRFCYGLSTTDENGLILSGSFDVDGPYTKSWLTKLNSEINYEWLKTFGGENTRSGIYDMIPTQDGGYIACGTWFNSSVILYGHIFIIKVNIDGNLQWEQMIPGQNSEDDLRGLAITAREDGYIICGNYQEMTAYDDIFLLKIDLDGDTTWSKRIGGSYADKSTDIISTSDGGFLVSGYTYNNTFGGTDAYLLKMDAFGHLVHVDSKIKLDDIKIIPNPFSDSFRIQSGDGINEIIIHSIDNKFIQSIKFPQFDQREFDISLSTQKSGFYLVSIIYKDHIEQRKILKI